MGEKTTIEIDKMRELKQHALDTNKTLKQIINEAIWEKITRERKNLNLPPLLDLEPDNAGPHGADITGPRSGKGSRQSTGFDPQILNIIRSECARNGLSWDSLAPHQWNEKLEYGIQTALELLYDESVALDTVKQIKAKLQK